MSTTNVNRPEPSEGWKSYALALEKENAWMRSRLEVVNRHKSDEPDVWYWQNDGEDHLESMANSLPVIIKASELRSLIENAKVIQST